MPDRRPAPTPIYKEDLVLVVACFWKAIFRVHEALGFGVYQRVTKTSQGGRHDYPHSKT